MTYPSVLIDQNNKRYEGGKLPLLAKGVAIGTPDFALRRITDVWITIEEDGTISRVTYFLGTKEVA